MEFGLDNKKLIYSLPPKEAFRKVPPLICKYLANDGTCMFNFMKGVNSPTPSLAWDHNGKLSLNSPRYHSFSCSATFLRASDETTAERQTKCDQYDPTPVVMVEKSISINSTKNLDLTSINNI